MTHVIRRGISQGAADARYGAPLETADQGYLFLPSVGVMFRGTSQSIVGSNNQVRAFQFVLPFRLTVSDVQFRVTAAYANREVGIGIYSADGNTLLVDTGVVSAASAGLKKATLSTPVTLAPGPYWYAWTSDYNAVKLTSTFADSTFDSLFSDTNPQMGTAANAGSEGVLPATLGAITYGSFAIPHALMKP
jgi:hypothetical protein